MDSNILVKYLQRCRIFPLPSSLDAFKKEVYEKFSINPSAQVNLQYYSECWGEHIDLVEDAEIVPGKKYRVLVEVPQVLFVAAPVTNSDASLNSKISDINTSFSSVNNQESVKPYSNRNPCSSTSPLSAEDTQITIPAEDFSKTLQETLRDQKPLSLDLKSEFIQIICENVEEKYPTSLKMTDMARAIIYDYPFLKEATGNGYARWREAIQNWFIEMKRFDQSKEVLKVANESKTSEDLQVSDLNTSVSLHGNEQSIQPPSNTNQCSSASPIYATQMRIPAENFSETLRRTLRDKKPLPWALKSEFIRVICESVEEKYPSSIKVIDMARAIISNYPYLKETTGNGYAKWRSAIKYWFIEMRKSDQSEEVLKRKKKAIPTTDSDISVDLDVSDNSTSVSLERIQQSIQSPPNSNPCSSTASFYSEDTQVRIPAENFSESLRKTLRNQKPLPWALKSEFMRVICEQVEEKYPSSLKMTDMARAIVYDYPYLKETTGNGYAKWRTKIQSWFMERRKSDHSEEVLKRKKKAILTIDAETSVDLEVSDSSPSALLKRTQRWIQSPSNSNPCSITAPFYAVHTKLRVPAEKFSESLRKTLRYEKPLSRGLKSEFMRVFCEQVEEIYPSSIKMTDMARVIIYEYPYLKDTTGNGYSKWREAIRNWFKEKRRPRSGLWVEVQKRKTKAFPSTDSDTSVDMEGVSDIIPSVSLERIQQSIQSPSNSNPCLSTSLYFAEDTKVRIPGENFSETLRKTLRDQKPLSWGLKSEFMRVICEEVEEKYPSSLKITDMARAIIYDYPYLKETTGSGYAKWREALRNWFRERRRYDYSKEVLKWKKKAIPVFDTDISEVFKVSDNSSFVSLDENQQSNQFPPYASSLLSAEDTRIRIPAENFSETLLNTLKDKKPLPKALKFEFIRGICKQVEEKYPAPITMTDLARAIICDYPYLKETTGSGYARWRLAIKNWFRLRRKLDQSKEVLERETNESPATDSDTSMEDSDFSTSVSLDGNEQSNQSSPCSSSFLSAITQVRIPDEKFSETLRETLRDKKPLSWVLKSEFIRVICQQVEEMYPSSLKMTDMARTIICDYPYLKEATGNGYAKWREAIRNAFKRRRADQSKEVVKRKRSEKRKEVQRKKIIRPGDLIPEADIKQELEFIYETLNEIEREF